LPLPSTILIQKFPFEPTKGQLELFELLDTFLDKEKKHKAMLVKGFAGTGKTSMLQALVHTLPLFNYKYMLLAPTGRAAKVMSGYTSRSAFTIHKIIYKQVATPGSGILRFKLTRNYSKRTVFIIDEASMLSEEKNFGKKGLLSDLISYVTTDPTNKLMLIGDTAQLPPVGQPMSAALDIDYLKACLNEEVLYIELQDIMRHEIDSGILENATALRQLLKETSTRIKLKVKGHDDVFSMTRDRLEEGLQYAYDVFGIENAKIICRSNREAVNYNRHIRRSFFYRVEPVEAGDLLMIVRNNYFYLPPETPSGFLANGDFVEVMKVSYPEEMYNMHFATLRLRLLDYPDVEPFEAVVNLDSLESPAPALTKEEEKSLYDQIKEEYKEADNQKEMNDLIRQDQYLNALQVKYAYAITCHKAQGGQWDTVFIDQGYIDESREGPEFVRWLYTALTRATKQAFLINFNPGYFQ